MRRSVVSRGKWFTAGHLYARRKTCGCCALKWRFLTNETAHTFQLTIKLSELLISGKPEASLEATSVIIRKEIWKRSETRGLFTHFFYFQSVKWVRRNCLNTTSKLSRNLEDRKKVIGHQPFFKSLDLVCRAWRTAEKFQMCFLKSFSILSSLRDLSLYKVNNTLVTCCACDSKLSELLIQMCIRVVLWGDSIAWSTLKTDYFVNYCYNYFTVIKLF